MISLACEAGDHAQCYRSTCDCHCGHPGRLSDDDRARLEARPAPSVTPIAAVKVDEPPRQPAPTRRRRQPRAPRPRRICIDCPEPVDRPGSSKRCTSCHETWLAGRSGGAPSLNLPIEEIAAAYRAGASSVELGVQHHCSATTILNHLRAAGVPIRPRAANKAFRSVEVPIDEIIRLYAAGQGTKKIAVLYGCSAGTIQRRLEEAGVTIRRQGDRSIPLPIEEIVAAYQAGESCEEIGPRLGVNASTIAKRLREAGIDVDRNGRRKIPLEVLEVIAREYADGDSTETVAARHQLGATTVRRYLARAGLLRPVGSKPNGSPRRLDLPDAEIARRYEYGWSLLDLAAEYGCSDKAIRDRVVAAGVTIRPACRHVKAVA